MIIEPVLGEGGFVPAPPEFMRALRALADKHGILLIADEDADRIRADGHDVRDEHSGVAADLTTIAKSLAGGLPLPAVVGRADVMDAVEPGGLGGTFAGNPVACAAAIATLDAFASDDVLGRARAIGAAVHARARRSGAALRRASRRGARARRDASRSSSGSAPDERAATCASASSTAARERGLLIYGRAPR